MFATTGFFGLAVVVFFGGCAVVALTDMLWRRIPNGIVLVILVSVFLLVADGRMALPVVALSLGLSAGLLLVGTLLFACGLIGGGDVKLICAMVPWFPLEAAVQFVCLALVYGGVLAIATWGLRQAAERGIVRTGVAQRRLLAAQLCVPYGVSIAAAGMHVFVSVWF